MTEEQIHTFVKLRPARFRAAFTGRVRHARALEMEWRSLPHGDRKRDATRRSHHVSEKARCYLDGALESHGGDVHTDVLNAYMVSVISGHRAGEF